MTGRLVYVVGRLRAHHHVIGSENVHVDLTSWELVGLAETEAEADAACTDPNDFFLGALTGDLSHDLRPPAFAQTFPRRRPPNSKTIAADPPPPGT